MRKLLVAVLFPALILAGCASHQPVPQGRPRRTTDDQSPPTSAPRTPPGPRPAPKVNLAGPKWYPAGGRISKRWTTVVVHHSATATGSAQAFDRFHRGKGWDELGYHFVIGNGSGTPDGVVEVGPRWHKQKHGAHCKTPSNYYNEHGIGVCLVGDFTKSRPSQRQLASLTQLVRFLSAECQIPPDRITTHGLITKGTQCPGRNFPLSYVRRNILGPATASSLP